MRIVALDGDGTLRILEIIYPLLADRSIVEAAQIDPRLREKMDKERRGVNPV